MTTQVSNTVSIAAASKVGTSQSDKDILNLVLNELAAIRMMLGCSAGGTGAGILKGSKTWDPGAVADSTAQALTTDTCTGAAVGDIVIPTFSLTLAGLTLSGYVSAADTVTIKLDGNTSGGSVNLASGTLKYMVIPQAAFAQVLAAMVLTA